MDDGDERFDLDKLEYASDFGAPTDLKKSHPSFPAGVMISIPLINPLCWSKVFQVSRDSSSFSKSR